MDYRKLLAVAAIVVVAVLAVALVPMFMGDENDANPTASISLKKGQSWEWTPTFPSGLSPVLTVATSSSAMPSNNASFAASATNASISNGKLTVSIPSDYSGNILYVKLKAATTQPTQVVYYEITVNILNASVSYSQSTVHANVGSAITNITPTVTGATAKSYAISPALPSGLSFNTTTGVISGTPSANSAQANYTVTVTLNTTPSQTVITTVSIGAFQNIDAGSDYTVYAIKGTTAISVPGVTIPTGTILISATQSWDKDNVHQTVSPETAFNGITAASATGAVTGTPTVAGKYTITETFYASAETGGSSDSRTITIFVEEQVALGGASSANSYSGHSDTATVTKSAGPDVSWSIIQIKKNGSAITSGTDFSAFSQSNGVITCGTGATDGTYVVTIKAMSSSNKTTSSGATGSSSANNYATRDVTFTVAKAISITNSGSLDFYMATDKVYDSLTLQSNISGATWSIDSYGTGIAAANISVSSAGAVSSGTTAMASSGNFTVTIKAVDPNNPTNAATATLNVHVANALVFSNTPTAGQLAS